MVVCIYHLALNVGERFTTVRHRGGDRGHRAGITLALACALGLERFSATRAARPGDRVRGRGGGRAAGLRQEISFDNAKGPLIVLGAPLAFALFNVITKPLITRHSPLGVSAAASLIGTAALLPLTVRRRAAPRGVSLDAWDWR